MAPGEVEYRLCEATSFALRYLGFGARLLGVKDLSDDLLCKSFLLRMRSLDLQGTIYNMQEDDDEDEGT